MSILWNGWFLYQTLDNRETWWHYLEMDIPKLGHLIISCIFSYSLLLLLFFEENEFLLFWGIFLSLFVFRCSFFFYLKLTGPAGRLPLFSSPTRLPGEALDGLFARLSNSFCILLISGWVNESVNHHEIVYLSQFPISSQQALILYSGSFCFLTVPLCLVLSFAESGLLTLSDAQFAKLRMTIPHFSCVQKIKTSLPYPSSST